MKRYQIAALLFVFVCLTIACGQGEKSIPPPKDLTKLALQFVNSMVFGDFEKATSTFTSRMKEGRPAEELEKIWDSIDTGNGYLRRLAGVRAARWGDYTCVYVQCEFGAAKLDVKVIFDEKSRIAGLWFVKPNPPNDYEPVSQDSAEPVEDPTATEAPAETVRQALGFVDLLVNRDFGTAVSSFDDTMAEKLTADKLKKSWERILYFKGRFLRKTRARSTRLDHFDIVYVTLELEKSTLDVKVAFDHDQRVTGLSFE